MPGRPTKAAPIVATCQSHGQVATPPLTAPRPPPISPSSRGRRSRSAAAICALPHHRDSQVARAIRFAGISVAHTCTVPSLVSRPSPKCHPSEQQPWSPSSKAAAERTTPSSPSIRAERTSRSPSRRSSPEPKASLEQLRALTPVLERSEDLNTLRERCEEVERQVADMEGTTSPARGRGGAARAGGRDHRRDRPAQGAHGRVRRQDRRRAQAAASRSRGSSVSRARSAAVRGDAEGLRKQLDEMGEDVTRMRTQADDALRAHRHSTSRLEAFDRGVPGRHRPAGRGRAPGAGGRARARAGGSGGHRGARPPAPARGAQGARRPGGAEVGRAGAAARGGGPRRDPDLPAHPARPRAGRVAPPAGGADPPLRRDRGQDRRGRRGAGQGDVALRGAAADGDADRGGAAGRPASRSTISGSRCGRAARASSWRTGVCTR